MQNKLSSIREVYEYGLKRKKQIGEKNVFDFSLGNPKIKPPDIVNETLIKLLKKEDPIKLHSYTVASGDYEVRKEIVEYLNKKYKTNNKPENMYITCGCAASLSISLNALLNKKEEVIVLSPFFPEYKTLIEKANGKTVIVKTDKKTFDIDLELLKNKINKKTKIIIINSPNNPSGAIYKKETLIKLEKILQQKQKEYNTQIFVISDEPYRELVYDKIEVPYVSKFIKNTISCYSFSKSLSLPGERIGYILVSNKIKNDKEIYTKMCISARQLGYVCAPSLFQYLIKEVIGKTSDISFYDKNRKLLYNILKKAGFECVYPQGAFYLYVKSPKNDAKEFCERAKKYELLFVRGDDFGDKNYVRLAYCVDTDMIKRSEKAFNKLGKEYFD